jgi:isopenicillin N synthase-like dioxygenase
VSLQYSQKATAALRQVQYQTASELGAACEHAGFFYVTNHGVDATLLKKVLRMAHEYFSSPLEAKLLSRMPSHVGPSMGRGYQQLGQNVTQGARDWHEAIDMFRELSEAEQCAPSLQEMLRVRPELGHLLLGNNIWPPSFDRSLTARYVDAMQARSSSYQGSIKALLRLHALLMLYKGFMLY